MSPGGTTVLTGNSLTCFGTEVSSERLSIAVMGYDAGGWKENPEKGLPVNTSPE